MAGEADTHVETRALCEAVLESLPHPVLIHDDEGIIYANAPAMAILRADFADQIVGKPVECIVHEDGREAGAERRRLVTTHGTPLSGVPIKLRALDGTVVYMSCDARLLHVDGRKAILVTGTVLDASARRR